MKKVAGLPSYSFCFLLTMLALALPQVYGSYLPEAPMPAAGEGEKYDYRVLATNRTSALEKELNQAAATGYRFQAAMGGETAFGGSETLAVLSKPLGTDVKQRYEYKLLATSRTSTMQKELQDASDAGFEYRDQTVFKTTFGGKEVVVIMERDREAGKQKYDYKLLATSRTSTMEKELKQAGEAGFEFLGVTIGQTAIGGSEVVSILRRPATK
jgi:hypothetical protein